MSTDEREIFQFLKSWGLAFVSGREIARRAATKKRFYDDPHWAQPMLINMVARGILEGDAQGRYRIKPLARNKKQQWVAPDIAKILEESGVQATAGTGVEGDIAADEYYERL